MVKVVNSIFVNGIESKPCVLDILLQQLYPRCEKAYHAYNDEENRMKIKSMPARQLHQHGQRIQLGPRAWNRMQAMCLGFPSSATMSLLRGRNFCYQVIPPQTPP